MHDEAFAYEGYRIVATVNGDFEMVCMYHQETPFRFEPTANNLLEALQTARNHNKECLEHMIGRAKYVLQLAGNTRPVNSQIAPLIPEEFRPDFWNRAVDKYFQSLE